MGSVERSSEPRRALVLTGGVAKGAFEAGVLARLVEAGVRFDSVVGTSAGALSGLLLAHGAAAERLGEAAKSIEHLWRDEASLFRFASPALADLISRTALSRTDRVVDLLRSYTPPLARVERAIDFVCVATDARGYLERAPGRADAWLAGFETAFRFSSNDFCDEGALSLARRAAVASAAFPVLFAPVEMPPGYERHVIPDGGCDDCIRDRSGAFYDGGLRNNNPIKYALEAGAIDEVVVVSAFPVGAAYAGPPRGLLDIAGRVFEILVNGGIAGDLAAAHGTNVRLAQFAAFAGRARRDCPELAEALIAEVGQVSGLAGKRAIEVASICPAAPLPGTVFTGFVSRRLRALYIDEGRRAAERFVAKIVA
jgi:predicted acylesterase/phospholipase RssA